MSATAKKERVTGRHKPRRRQEVHQRTVRVYVWQFEVRLLHWVIFLSILVLAVTGIYIGNPYILSPGEASDHFVMGTMKVVHFSAAVAFTVAVLARLLWMFLGNRYARWNQFVPVKKARRKHLWETFKYYLFVRKQPPPTVGHNALAGAVYTVVFLLYAGMIATGLGMYAVDHPDSWVGFMRHVLPVFGGTQTARFLHHIGMWLILGFFVHHLASSILMSVAEKNGLLGSIFSGFKWFREDDYEEAKEE